MACEMLLIFLADGYSALSTVANFSKVPNLDPKTKPIFVGTLYPSPILRPSQLSEFTWKLLKP